MTKSVGFTGHRDIAKDRLPQVLDTLWQVTDALVAREYLDFYTGGARGWDTYCALTVLKMRKENPKIALHLVLPCAPEEQAEQFTQQQWDIYHYIYRNADTCEFVSGPYTPTSMKTRNQRIIYASDCCVCYYDPTRSRSGTGQAIRMAEEYGVPILNIAQINLSDLPEILEEL